MIGQFFSNFEMDGVVSILSKSMLSKCAKFDYFSKVGEWFPKYFQSVLDVTLGLPAP